MASAAVILRFLVLSWCLAEAAGANHRKSWPAGKRSNPSDQRLDVAHMSGAQHEEQQRQQARQPLFPLRHPPRSNVSAGGLVAPAAGKFGETAATRRKRKLSLNHRRDNNVESSGSKSMEKVEVSAKRQAHLDNAADTSTPCSAGQNISILPVVVEPVQDRTEAMVEERNSSCGALRDLPSLQVKKNEAGQHDGAVVGNGTNVLEGHSAYSGEGACEWTCHVCSRKWDVISDGDRQRHMEECLCLSDQEPMLCEGGLGQEQQSECLLVPINKTSDGWEDVEEQRTNSMAVLAPEDDAAAGIGSETEGRGSSARPARAPLHVAAQEESRVCNLCGEDVGGVDEDEWAQHEAACLRRILEEEVDGGGAFVDTCNLCGTSLKDMCAKDRWAHEDACLRRLEVCVYVRVRVCS